MCISNRIDSLFLIIEPFKVVGVVIVKRTDIKDPLLKFTVNTASTGPMNIICVLLTSSNFEKEMDAL